MVNVLLSLMFLYVIFLLPSVQREKTFWPSHHSKSKFGKFNKAAVSTDSAACAVIGKNILKRNGSAVDAAIGTLVCMGAHAPESMGLGGGFHMIYYNRSKKKAYYIDAREVAPEKASEDMFNGNATQSNEGPLSVAVPGELAGYSEVHRLFGRLSWRELFKPTINMCRRGIKVSPHLADTISKNKEKLKKCGVIGEIFLRNGTEVYKVGERVKMLDLANTLEAIADQGRKALYGPSALANKFLQDLKDMGSIITCRDMRNYAVRMRKVVQVKLRNNSTLYATSPPGSGVLLAFMMSILDGYPDFDESVAEDKEKTVLAYHRILESLKYSYAQRSQMEDNDKEMKKLIAKLTSKAYTDAIRSKIEDCKTYNDASHYGYHSFIQEDHGTSHLSLVAPNGDAVSVTSTINNYFGSCLVSPSTGIILNDEMDDFSSPDVTNIFEVPPTPMNHIKPGRRPMSSMTPIIMVDAEGNVTLVLGGIGGTTITSGVLQVAARSFFFKENIKKSIDAPRIHHQLMPNELHYEKEFPMEIVEELRKFGHNATEWSKKMHGIMMGIKRNEDGVLHANSDYRIQGQVDGW